MKIFGDGKSGNCLKVKWVCNRLGLPYRWIETDFMKGETRTPHSLS
jgi:glutathione S-transferase